MARTNKILALLAMSSMLPAAAVAQGRNWNPSLDSVNQPVVQRTDYAFDVDASSGGLSDRELHRLRQWFASLRLGYGDEINVDTGAYDNARARQDIAAVAGDYGLLLGQSAPITAGTVQPGSIRVVVSRAEAFVPGCPNWQEAYEVGNRMTTGSNYGCAMNSNLAAMIANPNDLVLGQSGERGGDALTTTKAVDAYRRRVPSGQSGEVKAESAGGK
jgi:pilus assembly protein CpaD